MTATTEPLSVRAGDTVAWTRTLEEYPASDSWVLTYTLINASAKITIAASASGADHAVAVAAATTASWAPGTYSWMARVAKAGEKYTVDQGTIQIERDLAAATTYDTRSSARKALDAVNTALESYGNKAYLQEFEINGRRQRFASPADFLTFRSKLMAEVAREDNAERIRQGLSPRNQLAVRFNTR